MIYLLSLSSPEGAYRHVFYDTINMLVYSTFYSRIKNEDNRYYVTVDFKYDLNKIVPHPSEDKTIYTEIKEYNIHERGDNYYYYTELIINKIDKIIFGKL